MEIQHVLHEQHPLKLIRVRPEDVDDGRTCAAGCDEALMSGHDLAYYACDPCGLYLHQSCGDLPSKMEHPIHPCPLFLKLVPAIFLLRPRKKPKRIMMLWYRCDVCKFGVVAASGKMFLQINNSEENEKAHILHFSHDHPLEICYAESHADLQCCNGCKKPISGKSYGCKSCGYYLDQSCASLPEKIQHFYHRCPLFIKTNEYAYNCDACFEKFSKNIFIYSCGQCSFRMHPACAQFLPLGSDEEGILQIGHHHPLKLISKEADKTPGCRACDKPITGKAYACCSCGFYLHESCGNLPQEIRHFLHPNCVLFLELLSSIQFCDACGSFCVDYYGYRCQECDFTMHVECTRFLPIDSDEDGIMHISHHHPLKLTFEDADENSDCGACVKPIIAGRRYACCTCKFYIHEACGNLPPEIRHFYHPDCILIPKRIREGENCDACLMRFNRGNIGYHCGECDFKMHMSCAQFPPIGPDDEGDRIQHLSHYHPLKLTFEDADENSDCGACDKPITAGRRYACCTCKFYIHEACGNLPPEIRHFYHPDCTLIPIRIMEDENCDACLIPKRIREGINCDACHGRIRLGNIGYHCGGECDFKMHMSCVQFPHIGPDDEGDRIQHLSHYHPLMLFEEKRDKNSLVCNLCSKKIDGQGYGACEACQFYIHKSCMGVSQEIQHRCHRCPISFKYVTWFKCDICFRESKLPSGYVCSKCDFRIDVECAHLSSTIIADDKAERILHFCHQHPLQLFRDLKRNVEDMMLKRKLECFVCGSLSSGLTYGCRECDVVVHKPCLDALPQTLSIQDASYVLVISLPERRICTSCDHSGFGFYFVREQDSYCVPCALWNALSISVNPSSALIKHPNHPCSLMLKSLSTFNCNACFTQCSTHAYYCDKCDFYVGHKCALSSADLNDEEGRIRHFSHWHLLQPLRDAGVTVSCRICRKGSLEPSYYCSKCDFYSHKSCLDILPQKVEHHYFNCTLVLLTTASYECTLCQKQSESGLAFRSIEKAFKLCMECFFRPKNKMNGDGTFSSIHHWHPLSLLDNLGKESCCLLCGGYSSGVMYYCRQCKEYFHKTCAELPFEMQHPLHPEHSLSLISTIQLPEQRRICSLCLRKCPLNDTPLSGIYHCKECNFQLDRKCASTCIPSIEYQDQRHLLTVVEYLYGQKEVCRVCSTPCESGTIVFRCIQCKFSIHLHCGPLPREIKHSCHVHPLMLEEFYVEDNYTDMFPCHICEGKRDPMLPVYCCKEGCPMICDILCARSEIMPKLLGHHGGDVELITIFPNEESKVIPRDEIMERMRLNVLIVTHHEISTGSLVYENVDGSDLDFLLLPMLDDWHREMLESCGGEPEREDEDAIKNRYSFSKEAFGHFSSTFGVTRLTLFRDGIPKFISQHGGRLIKGVPETLLQIYRQARNYNLHLHIKMRLISFIFSIFGVVLHDMRTTKMMKVTSERIRQWLTLLMLVKRNISFDRHDDVGFVIGKLKQVWDAHFLIKAKQLADDTSEQFRKKLEDLSRKEEYHLRELQATRNQIVEVKDQEYLHHKHLGIGLKSMRKEYADVLLIKWKPAITFLEHRDDYESGGSPSSSWSCEESDEVGGEEDSSESETSD